MRYKRRVVSGKVKILTGGNKNALHVFLKPASGIQAADSVQFRSQRLQSGWKKRRPTMGISHTHNHQTNANNTQWSSEKIAKYALFVALSMAVSFIEFPLIPDFSFLKYDPSGIVCLVAGFAYGPAAAAIVSILGFAPHLFTNPLGTVMAVLVSLGASVTAAIVYKKMHTKKRRNHCTFGRLSCCYCARNSRKSCYYSSLRSHDCFAGCGSYYSSITAV